MTKVIFTQPSFFCLSEIPADCNDRILIHIPGVTRVLEWAGFPGAFPSSACVIHADISSCHMSHNGTYFNDLPMPLRLDHIQTFYVDSLRTYFSKVCT
jgi:hypothetical protein